MKTIKFGFAIFLLIFIWRFLWVFDPIIRPIYKALSKKEISEISQLEKLKTLRFEELPEEVQNKFEGNLCSSFEYHDLTYYQIDWFDRYIEILPNTPVLKLLTPDRLILGRIRIPNLNKTQYLAINVEVLKIYASLIEKCQARGIQTNEITITSGFRFPNYNTFVGGASCSQHQVGTAIDISIGDVNSDGTVNLADRKIVQEILDKEIVKSNGGLGTYKNHQRLIHFDVRGKRARW